MEQIKLLLEYPLIYLIMLFSLAYTAVGVAKMVHDIIEAISIVSRYLSLRWKQEKKIGAD